MNRKILVGAIAVVAVVGVGAWLGMNKTAVQETAEVAPTTQPAETVDTSGIVEMTLGAADAPITLVEYASFTCPHCANFHKSVLVKLIPEYVDTGKVRFVYRDVYFDKMGLWASLVARCGGPVRFFGITDMLYTQQSEWLAGQDPAVIADNLRKIGKVAGLQDDQIKACLADSAKAEALVTWFKTNVEADDVSSTPTLIIDGEKHSNMTYIELKAILDKKLGQ